MVLENRGAAAIGANMICPARDRDIPVRRSGAVRQNRRNQPPAFPERCMRALFFGIVLLWPAAVTAQSAAWSYAELLKQSLQSHPSIQARRSSATAAQFDVDAAEWQRFPTPTVESLSRSSSTPNVPNGRLRVQQPLWTGGRI